MSKKKGKKEKVDSSNFFKGKKIRSDLVPVYGMRGEFIEYVHESDLPKQKIRKPRSAAKIEKMKDKMAEKDFLDSLNKPRR